MWLGLFVANVAAEYVRLTNYLNRSVLVIVNVIPGKCFDTYSAILKQPEGIFGSVDSRIWQQRPCLLPRLAPGSPSYGIVLPQLVLFPKRQERVTP
jgi:hypothetical protein